MAGVDTTTDLTAVLARATAPSRGATQGMQPTAGLARIVSGNSGGDATAFPFVRTLAATGLPTPDPVSPKTSVPGARTAAALIARGTKIDILV